MASLTRLKQDIQFNAQLGGLLEALKSIAAQQFQALERLMGHNATCFEAMATIAGTFDLERFPHPFTQGTGPIGVIAVTSDTGLLGGLNQQVVSTAVQEYRREPGELMLLGERGGAYAKEFGLSYKSFPGIQEHNRGTLAAEVRDYALNRVLSGQLGSVSIVYPRALSFSLQRVELVRALPCLEWFREGTVTRGVRSGPVVLESSLADVVEYLAWLWVGCKLYEVLGLSHLAELAARAVHLEGSSQELERRREKLWGRYFRERREVIDRNLRELFAARSLYANALEQEDAKEWAGDPLRTGWDEVVR